MTGRKQLNIKFQPDELEALRKAKEASGKTYHDLLLQGAGVKSGSRPEKPEPPRDPGASGRAGANPRGIDANPDTGPEDQFRESSEDTEPEGEETTRIRPEIAEALRENTRFLERANLPAAAKQIRESGFTWRDLNDSEKEALLLELDGVEKDKHLDTLNETAEVLDEDAIVLAEHTKQMNTQLVDLSGDQVNPQVLKALKPRNSILDIITASSPDLLGSVRKLAETSKWDDLQDVDRAHLVSQLPEKEEDKLPELAEILATDEKTLRTFRDRLIREKKGHRLRPESVPAE